MFNFLRIFSWLLFTFGLVGALAVIAGFAPGVGSTPAALGLLGTQALFAAAILYGFRLHRTGKLARSSLIYGGWFLVIALIVIGQTWINVADINL